MSIGTGSSTWTVDDNNNTLSFRLASIKFVSGDGIYFEGVKLGGGGVDIQTSDTQPTGQAVGDFWYDTSKK